MFKEIFYDWFGYNLSLFHSIYNFFKQYDLEWLWKFIDAPVYLANKYPANFSSIILLFFIILIMIIGYENDSRFNFKSEKIKSIVIACGVFVMSYFSAEIYFINDIKGYFHLVRPFCDPSLQLEHYLELMKKYDCNRSFPSGHAILTATFVFSFLPILSKYLKYIFCLILVITLISRVAIGAHYPVDVVAGAILGWFIVCIYSMIIHRILNKINT